MSGNFIGTDKNGTQAIPNLNEGIKLDDAANVIIGSSNASPGSACSGECNLISGNNGGGITIGRFPAQNNVVSGNYIGTNLDGNSRLANNGDGLSVLGGASNNFIGGSTAEQRNLISGNGGYGIGIGEESDNNEVMGNFIGTNAGGTSDLGNFTYGIKIWNTQGNTVGPHNTIAYNNYDGVAIVGEVTIYKKLRKTRFFTITGKVFIFGKAATWSPRSR